MRRFAALLVAASLALAGCSSPPESGYVEHKQHSDAYDYETMTCFSYSTQGICTFWMPIENHMDATWGLCLRDDKDPHNAGCRDVDEQTFNAYQVGDYYPRGGK